MPDVRANTDESGNYILKGLPAGKHSIVLTNHEYEMEPLQTQEVELAAGEHKGGVDFVMGDTTDIRGKVVSEDNQPLENINVAALIYKGGHGKHIGTAHDQSDRNGEFVIKDVPQGDTIQFQVTGKGYGFKMADLPMDGEYKIIVMQKSGTIKGIVLDSQKQPVSEASVYPVRIYSGGDDHPMTYQTITTGADGSFEFEDMDPGEYKLSATAERYTVKESEPLLLKQGESIDNVIVTLESGMVVTGVVLGPEGQPVANAQVNVHSYIPNSNRRSWSSSFNPITYPQGVITDGEGKFMIDDFPPRDDALVVQHPDYAPTVFAIAQAQLPQQPFTIRLTTGGVIEGKVSGTDGKPLVNHPMIVQNFPENLFKYQTVTNEQGEYRFEKMPPVHMMVLKTINEVAKVKEEYKTVKVEEGGSVRADFGTGEGALVHGTVYVQGKPAAGVQVDLEGEERSQDVIGSYFSTLSNELGLYSFAGIQPGRYQIYASREHRWRLTSSQCDFAYRFEIAAEQQEYPYDFHLNSYEIQGLVTDANTGAPLAGVHIRSLQPPVSIQALSDNTDAEGKFILTPPKPGEYKFIAFKQGYENKEFQVNMAELTPGNPFSQTQVEVNLVPDTTALTLHLLLDGHRTDQLDTPLYENRSGRNPAGNHSGPQTGSLSCRRHQGRKYFPEDCLLR